MAGASAPVTFLITTTGRGDVAALTNTAGAVFARYTYGPYGEALTSASNAVTGVTAELAEAIAARQPLRYAGYVYDAHSATYYLSARHYDPATARFLTKDPARDDGEESAYQYCGGDPVGKVDPTGLRGTSNTRVKGTSPWWSHAGHSVNLLFYAGFQLKKQVRRWERQHLVLKGKYSYEWRHDRWEHRYQTSYWAYWKWVKLFGSNKPMTSWRRGYGW